MYKTIKTLKRQLLLHGFHYRLLSIFLVLLLATASIQMSKATDGQQKLPRYLANSAALTGSSSSSGERIQQIMKGVGPGEIRLPTRKKTAPIDVKVEIAKLNTTYIYQNDWPADNLKLGAVTAVSFDKAGNVVIFHRVDRIWDQNTFDLTNSFQETYKGPIRENTVLGLEHNSGKVLYGWGKNIFYMPHGLTVDPEDNVWVTDVALHQVFKFAPRGAGNKPLLTLGTAFEPGAGKSKYCKPTSVAVLNNGDFFVADGYCNARILKYNKAGELLLSWGQNSFSGNSYDVAPVNFFAIPHALTLIPEQNLLCTADRENGRVQCFYSSNGTFHSQYYNQVIGDRLFSLAYTPAEGGQFVIVNGPTAELGFNAEHYNEVHGYVMNVQSQQITSKFGTNNLQFENPHDVAVTVDGNEIYVAELNPTRIHKFLHKSLSKPMSLSAAKPTATISEADDANVANKTLSISRMHEMNTNASHSRPSGTAILVSTLMLLFILLMFVLSLIVARRRKRGCMLFGAKNRRHAWDKSDGFKLGGLQLGRRSARNGFEKLDQDASDEEPETSATSALTSAQFA